MPKNSRIITRHGETPATWTENNLMPYEVGWSTTDKQLYINDNGDFSPIGGKEIAKIIRSSTAPTVNTAKVPLTSILWIDTASSMYIPKIYDSGAWHPLGAVFY